MKVLYVLKTNKGAKWALAQAKKLNELGIEIVVVMPNANGENAKLYNDANMRVVECDFNLPINKPLSIFSKIKEVQHIIDREKPDIIHCHFFTNIVMIRLALRKNKNIPRVFQVPGPLHLENIIFRNIDIYSSTENDFWIATCKKSLKIYKQNIKSVNKSFLAYYGGYGGETINQYIKTGKLRREFDIDNNEFLVGMVSYFYKPKYHLMQLRGLKGHEDFIEAIRILRNKGLKVKGIIIGGPWGNSFNYMKKLKRIANKKCGDSIIFTGFRNDIKEIYKDIDVVVHP